MSENDRSSSLPDQPDFTSLRNFIQGEAEKFSKAKDSMHPLSFVQARQNFILWILKQIINIQAKKEEDKRVKLLGER